MAKKDPQLTRAAGEKILREMTGSSGLLPGGLGGYVDEEDVLNFATTAPPAAAPAPKFADIGGLASRVREGEKPDTRTPFQRLSLEDRVRSGNFRQMFRRATQKNTQKTDPGPVTSDGMQYNQDLGQHVYVNTTEGLPGSDKWKPEGAVATSDDDGYIASIEAPVPDHEGNADKIVIPITNWYPKDSAKQDAAIAHILKQIEMSQKEGRMSEDIREYLLASGTGPPLSEE